MTCKDKNTISRKLTFYSECGVRSIQIFLGSRYLTHGREDNTMLYGGIDCLGHVMMMFITLSRPVYLIIMWCSPSKNRWGEHHWNRVTPEHDLSTLRALWKSNMPISSLSLSSPPRSTTAMTYRTIGFEAISDPWDRSPPCLCYCT